MRCFARFLMRKRQIESMRITARVQVESRHALCAQILEPRTNFGFGSADTGIAEYSTVSVRPTGRSEVFPNEGRNIKNLFGGSASRDNSPVICQSFKQLTNPSDRSAPTFD